MSFSHLPPQYPIQLLPCLPPNIHIILPPRQHPIQKPLVPSQQTLPRSPLTHAQQPDPIIRQRLLQLQLQVPAAIPLSRKDTHNLGVNLKAVEQVREIGEIERGGFLAGDVQPDEAGGADGAPEDFGVVEGFDGGEAGADEWEGLLEGSGAEGDAVVFWRGGVDGGNGRVVAGYRAC